MLNIENEVLDTCEEYASSQISDSHSDDSMDSAVCRLITEEDIIDSVFCLCDEENKGQIPVSKLIEYLQCTTHDDAEGLHHIEVLHSQLTPDGIDVEIDLNTCKRVVADWIQAVRLHSLLETHDEEMMDNSNIFLAPLTPRSARRNRVYPVLQGGNGSSPVSGNSGGCRTPLSTSRTSLDTFTSTTEDLDVGELAHNLTDLKQQNKKLIEDSNKIKKQLENNEDVTVALTQELEELKKSCKNQHHLVEKNKECIEEIDKLRLTISSQDEFKIVQEKHIKFYEKEVNTLSTRVEQLQDQLSQTTSDLEMVQRDRRHLKSSFNEQRQLRIKAEKKIEDNETIMVEKIQQVSELETMLKELSKINEVLKKEKADATSQLNKIEQELVMVQLKNEVPPRALDHSDDEEIMPVKLTPTPTALRLKNKRHSIHSEMEESLMHEILKSPLSLSDKELEEYQSISQKPSLPLGDDLDKEVEAIMKSTFSYEGYTTEAEKIANRYNKKKSWVIEQLNQLTSLVHKPEKDTCNCYTAADKMWSSSNPSPEFVNLQLKAEMNNFVDKISTLAFEKQKDEQRIEKLSDAVLKLKGKIITLQNKLDTSNFERKAVDKEDIKEENLQFNVKLEEVDKATETLQPKDTEIELLKADLDNVSALKNLLKKEVEALKIAHADLQDKYRKTEGQMEEIKDDAKLTSEKYVREKDKNSELEDSLTATSLARQLDLKELWRLVHKDVENECRDSGSEDTPVTQSADSVRDQVAKEIHSLRSQLARSQKALEALVQVKGLPLKTTTRDTNYDWKNNNKHSPSSPLVDALTLDFCDANPGEAVKIKQTSASADTLLDDNKNLSDSLLANSCPSLSHGKHTVISSYAQTEEFERGRPPHLGTNKYTLVNTSTGSSTSGVVDLEYSSGSNKSEPLGSMPTTKKSVLIVETICTPDSASSPDDPNDPLCRRRSPSFKRAIERGQSGDSSNQSFETCDPPSTSPDISPDRPELPPYPGPPHLRGGGDWKPVCNKGQLLHPHGNEYGTNTSYSSTDGTSSSLSWDHSYTCTADGGGVQWDYYMGDPSFVNQDGISPLPHKTDSALDHPGAKGDVHQGTENTVLVEAGPSPVLGRRLSTLVEEGSDAEADESLGPHGRHSTPKFKSKETKKAPPQYKQPPPYKQTPQFQDAINSTNRSQHGVQPHSDSTGSDPVTTKDNKTKPNCSSNQSLESERGFPPPYRKPDPPKSPRSGEKKEKESPPPRREFSNIESNTKLRKKNSDKKKIEDGQLIALASGEIEETELSEADKILNAQLLEEAKKVTATSRHRNKRSLKKTPSADLARSHSFDEGGEEEDEAFDSDRRPSDTLSVEAALEGAKTPPKSPKTKAKSPIKFKEDSEEDVKSEILEGLSQKPPKSPTGDSPTQPFRITTNLQLHKIREENLAKKRLTKQNKMPELSETSETESVKENMDSESDGQSEKNATTTEQTESQPKGSSKNVAFPSLPESVLKKMGLALGKKKQEKESADNISDQELEEKFATIALAFKTDKLTLDKRIELHERARDVAEQNIEKELEGLKEAMKKLSPFCTDNQSRIVYSKIQHHVEVLEKSTSRMSGKAEVHGAVQQEMRMNKAIEVMVQHTENLKRLYEREHTDLVEARKLLTESKIVDNSGGDPLQKRSFSVVAGTALKFKKGNFGGRTIISRIVKKAKEQQEANEPKPLPTPKLEMEQAKPESIIKQKRQISTLSQGGRRRASVAAFPKTMSMSGVGTSSFSALASASKEHFNMDSKSRFQSGTTDTNLFTPKINNAYRRASLAQTGVTDAYRRFSYTPSPVSLSQDTNNNASDRLKSSSDSTKAESTSSESNAKLSKPSTAQEEKVFQKGFEEGVKAQLNQELLLLREQQKNMCDDLDDLMEQSEVREEEMEYETIIEKVWKLCPEWEKSGTKLRFTLAGFVFIMALFSIIFTLIPVGNAHYTRTQWTSIAEVLQSFTTLRHYNPPPC